MIGPLPPPIHGMSIANNMLFNGLKNNHGVEVLNTNTEKRLGNLSKQGRLTYGKTFRSLSQILFGTIKILLGKRYDIVYLTPGQTIGGYLKYVPFMWAAKIRKIPYVIHIHGGYFRTMYNNTKGRKRKFIYRSLRHLSGAIVLGNSLRYMLEGLIPNEKIFVCENGVEDEIFATEEEIKNKIGRWKNDDTIRIVYLSNLMKAKGILDLLEAVKILDSKGKKVHLDVAGAIEPEIKLEIERYFAELGDVITYHGVVNGQTKKKLLLDNYIFCLPSNHPYGEGQPISILEAMANGCVLVTTDHGGIKDIVNKKYGIFVEKGSAESIAKTLETKLIKEMFIESWNEAIIKYHVSQFVRKIEDILYELYTLNYQRTPMVENKQSNHHR